MTRDLSPLMSLLRCLDCGSSVSVVDVTATPAYPELGPDGLLRCDGCQHDYPLIAGTPRMLDPAIASSLWQQYPHVRHTATNGATSQSRSAEHTLKVSTARSFAYEWEHFGDLRDDWRRNFLDYLRPFPPEGLDGRLVLDVGAGSGRHSLQAHELGAKVVAVDLGSAIDTARRNLPDQVLTVQADAERLPFAPGTFDFVMSLGVVHHLPNPPRGLRKIVQLVRPAGHVHVYLYWQPEQRWHRQLLRVVTLTRRVTVRLPHRLLHLLCYPLAGFLLVAFVAPYRALRHRPRGRTLAERLPLQAYADYPFEVLVNDQFDRFSAPLEHRYTREEARQLLLNAGIPDADVVANSGWVVFGTAPTMSAVDTAG